jgi:hypothetical protein
MFTWAKYEGSGTEGDDDEANNEVGRGQAHDEHVGHLEEDH